MNRKKSALSTNLQSQWKLQQLLVARCPVTEENGVLWISLDSLSVALDGLGVIA